MGPGRSCSTGSNWVRWRLRRPPPFAGDVSEIDRKTVALIADGILDVTCNGNRNSPLTLLLTPLRVSRRAYPRIQVQSTLKWNHQSSGIINQLLLTWEHDYKGRSMLNSYDMITGGGVDELGDRDYSAARG
jgi:hypothetical protein